MKRTVQLAKAGTPSKGQPYKGTSMVTIERARKRDNYRTQPHLGENNEMVRVDEPVHVVRSLYGKRNFTAGKGKRARRVQLVLRSQMAHIWTALRLGIPLNDANMLKAHATVQAMKPLKEAA